MTGRDLIALDANTIWHRRIVQALAQRTRLVCLSPRPDLRLRSCPIAVPDSGGAFHSIGLPPGWASRTAAIGQRLLLRKVNEAARQLHDPAVVLTSIAYAPLARMLKGRFPIVVYIADDYRSYGGWPRAVAREAELTRMACLSVFVSETLRQRAVEEYGIDAGRTLVSPNATEPRFAAAAPPLPVLEGLKRPIVGVLGGLSDRLDLDFLRRASRLPEIGTLLIAGPVAPELQREQGWLRAPQVHVVGPIAHASMHRYARAMDLALIPYAPTPLNRHCSPMRLFDHLATGVPILALPTCEQVNRCELGHIVTGDTQALIEKLPSMLGLKKKPLTEAPIFWGHRAGALLQAIERSCR